MTPEELMKPRFKVIADYPGSHFGDNQVLNLNYNNREGLWEYTWAEHDGMYDISEASLKEYPHLFRPLQWWEERDVKDMPEYVKWTKNWDSNPVREAGDVMVVEWISNSHFTSEGEDWKLTGGWFIPATETEWEEYLKTK